MNNATSTPDDDLPFVHEECGDTLWDAVLAQPAEAAPAAPHSETAPDTAPEPGTAPEPAADNALPSQPSPPAP